MSDDHYTYRMTWSPEDGEYVGGCLEFPSLSWLAPTREGAFAGICELVQEVLADLRANGKPIPAPLAGRAYSGKFVVRVPPETHRELVIQAAEEGVSLNRLVSARLASPPPGRIAATQGHSPAKTTKARGGTRAVGRLAKGESSRRGPTTNR